MITFTPLFSGSRGNCTLVRTEKQNILLDLGFGYRATLSKLSLLGLEAKDISCILITHEHSDHIGGLLNWTKHFHTKVYAPKNCCDYISQHCFCGDIVPIDNDFELADIYVEIYNCSHDARSCLGYRFSDGSVSAASVTDTGETTQMLTKFLEPCNKIILESNHDVNMLKKGNYPYQLKQRILSRYGHLSNEQAARTLMSLINGNNVKNIILAHLSMQNNTSLLALQTSTDALSEMGVKVGKDINIYVADQYNNEVTV